MSKYSLQVLKQLNKKELKKFTKVFNEFKSYDKIDIIIELSKKRKRKFKNENIYS